MTLPLHLEIISGNWTILLPGMMISGWFWMENRWSSILAVSMTLWQIRLISGTILTGQTKTKNIIWPFYIWSAVQERQTVTWSLRFRMRTWSKWWTMTCRISHRRSRLILRRRMWNIIRQRNWRTGRTESIRSILTQVRLQPRRAQLKKYRQWMPWWYLICPARWMKFCPVKIN